MADLSLTTKDYEMILQNKFQNPGIKFLEADLQPFSKNAEGFMGNYYKLRIIYKLGMEELKENFFVKTRLVKNVSQATFLRDSFVYEKEMLVHKFLLKEFKKIGLDTSFSPRSYLFNGTDTFVMDNIMETGYKMLDKGTFLDMEHLKSSLEALATFHGNSFIYEIEKSKELQRNYKINEEYPMELKEIYFTKDPNDPGYKWIEASMNVWYKLIDLFPNTEEYKMEFKNKLQSINLRDIFHKDYGFRKICSHGDLWSNNILFKRLDNGKLKANLVDYQTIRYFYPSFDVLLLIHYNTDNQFRKNHLEELFLFYYETLSIILQQRGYDVNNILPKEDFYKTRNMLKYQTVIMNYSYCCINSLPPKIIYEDLVDNFYDIIVNDRFSLIKKVIDDYPEYKIIIQETLLKLHDSLFN